MAVIHTPAFTGCAAGGTGDQPEKSRGEAWPSAITIKQHIYLDKTATVAGFKKNTNAS